MGDCCCVDVPVRCICTFVGWSRCKRWEYTDGTGGSLCFCFSYAGYIIGVRKTRAVKINSTVLTCYVMSLGALFYIIGACCTSGLRIVTDGYVWLIILGLALPATAISNITLVQAIKNAGPTLTSILGAMEPLTAVVIGVFVFNELFTLNTLIGILLILIAVSMVVFREHRMKRI